MTSFDNDRINHILMQLDDGGVFISAVCIIKIK